MRRLALCSRAAIPAALICLFHLTARASDLREDTIYSHLETICETDKETVLEFTLTGFEAREISDGSAVCTMLNIGDETRAAPEGWPDLPSVTRLVLIPPQSGVKLKCENLTTHLIPQIQIPAHQIERESLRDAENRSVFGLSPECSKLDGFWPPEPVRLGEPVILRGHRIIPVVINPFRWNPRTSELLVTDNLEITLDYDTDENRVNLVRDSQRLRPSQAVDRIISDLVVNPPAPHRDNGVRNGSIVYVMGNWNNVEQALQPLLEWRRRMGWTVQVLRVADNTSAAAIKAAIQAAYDDWDTPPEHVVICGDTDGDYRMAFWNMQRGADHPYESDHLFVTLEGDDIIPDAAVGRLIFGDLNMLNGIITKIINYESTPYLGDNARERGWQRRAAVIAGDSRSGRSSIDLCLWTKNLLLRNGYTRVNELYWTPQNQQPNANQFIRDNFSDGLSLYLYRGWTGMNQFAHAEVDELRNGRMLPFVMLATCNTGDYGEHGASPYYYTERFLYSTRGGAIGAVGAAGATHTAYNNLIAAEAFRAIYACGVPWQGWALMWSKIALFENYGPYDDIAHLENNGLDGWECETYIFNLMGDPAVELFTDVPRILDVEHAASIRLGESRFDIVVNYDDVGEPAPGMRVCLYKSGEFQFLKLTDADGHVVFNLDPETTQNGEIKLTITGHNIMPYLSEFRVARAEQFLSAVGFNVDDDDQGDSDGNGNGNVNPGERIELTIDVANLGGQVPDGEFDVILRADMPHLTVVEGEAHLNRAPAVGQSLPVTFLVDIEGGFPAEEDAVFQVEVSGQQRWHSSIQVPVEGAVLYCENLSWVGSPLEPGRVARFRIYVRNRGEIASGGLQGTLVSLTPTVNVPVPTAQFSSIPVGSRRLSQTTFQVAANIFHIGGSRAEFGLILENVAGVVDTGFFSFNVSEPGPRQPFGPDRYGYCCLDDEDENWVNAPAYNWIEIDPHRRGPGRNTNLSDTAEGDDHSALIDLPFEFTYYGQDFNQITVCTNGWLAMGDYHELTTGRNRRLPSGEIVPGMICPFWDDLLTTDNGGIYTWFDEDNHRFIIAWSQMRKLGPQVNNEPLETFEVILYDPNFYPTLTGDGDIVFQYNDVTDNRSCYQTWDTPFATVGIASPDQSDGLTYTYWGELSAGASALEDGRAIKFTTNMLTTTGRIFGVVTDAGNGHPLASATVMTEHGFVALTNEDGAYVMENAPAEVEFSITASMPGYNDSTMTELLLDEGGELELNFCLLHPEFLASADEINCMVQIDGQAEREFTVSNSGNGPLRWQVERRNPGNAAAEPWELRRSIPASEILNDSHIYSAVFTNERFYVAGGGANQPVIYVLDRDFQLIDRFDQFGESRYGITDLAWDGTLLWGSGESLLYGFTLDGQLVVTMDPPTHPVVGVAWDSDADLLWMCGTTSDIYGVTREGEQVARLSRRNLRTYGLAYYPDDPTGHNLYIFNRPGLTEMIVHRMRIADADTEMVRFLTPEAGGKPRGAFITPAWDYYSWVFIAGVDNITSDRIDVWQLDVRRDWMQIEPNQGELGPGSEQDFTLLLNPSGMPEVEIHGDLVFTHNAAGGETIIPVTMNVVGEIVREQRVDFMQGWNMISINLNPPLEMYENHANPGPDVIRMMAQMRIDEDHHHIGIMKDASGRFYAPQFGFCGIPYWNLTQGYQLSVDTDLQAVWRGEPIPADADLPLSTGWNLIAYYPDYTLSASAPDFYVLSSVIDNVVIAKDVQGAFMMPEYHFSNMHDWQPGQGYQVKVDTTAILNYPPHEEGRLAIVERDEVLRAEVPPTGENMSVLVNAFRRGIPAEASAVVAVDGSGGIVGRGIIADGRCGLAVWGDDCSTVKKDGLRTGEAFRLSLIDGAGAMTDLQPAEYLRGEGLVYQPDGFLVLNMAGKEATPSEYYLGRAYPNPFNAVVRIEYGLPEDVWVSIKAYDLAGRMVSEINGAPQRAGRHHVSWNAAELPSGLYLIRMEAGHFQAVDKALLVK